MMACVMPIVDDKSSESSPPGRLNDMTLSRKLEGLRDRRYYLVNTGFPASVSTKYSRGGYKEAKIEQGDIRDGNDEKGHKIARLTGIMSYLIDISVSSLLHNAL
jgi:hypothetical protein